MKIYFSSTKMPCVRNRVTEWHAEHGWCWNVQVDGTSVAVLFCTRLCGDGCIMHFDTAKYVTLPGAVILAAMRKAMRMLSPECDVIYATIVKQNEKLIRVAIRLGFRIVTEGGFLRDGKTEVVLLKYYPAAASYIKK